MTKPIILTAAAAFLLLQTGTAQAQQTEPKGRVLQAFVDICVAAAGDPDRALAAAEGMGWRETRWESTIPPAGVTRPPTPRGREIFGDGLGLRMQVEAMEAGDDGLRASTCSLFATPLRDAPPFDPDPVQATADWIGLETVAELTDENFAGYAFTVAADGSRRSLAGNSEEALDDVARRGEMHVIMVGRYGGQTVRLSYAKPTAD